MNWHKKYAQQNQIVCLMHACKILETIICISTVQEQEAQGFGALLDKMEDNDHIKLDNIEI